VIEWRAADGRYERLPDLAAELVQLKMDVIVAASTLATSAIQKASTTIPIVMINVANPVDSGFVESLARPGGNITGVSNMAGELSSKHLDILISMVPKLSRVALLVNPTNLAHGATRKNIQTAASTVGVKILPLEARNLQEIENAFSDIAKERIEAMIVAQDPVFNQYARQIAELARKYRMATAFGTREPVVVGGLMSYGSSNADAFRRAASYVDKILRGAKPSELPVEQPTQFELIINGKTAKALGLKIPQSILVQATEVIE